MTIRSTRAQSKKLVNQEVGTGFIIWKSTDTTTTECEFFIKDGQLFTRASGDPLSFEFGKVGLIKSLPIVRIVS